MLKFPINNAMFMAPQSTPESAWLGHIPFAGWLMDVMRPQILVELGTHRGASYLAFCQAIQRCAIATKCFAVDSWEGDEHSGQYGEEVYLQLLDYHQRNYAEFSRLMKMRFEDAIQYFADESIDLLHIDGMHTYEAVRNDFESWAPKLSPRGVVLFHDVNVREREFGVWRYWSELSARYPSFEFTHTHGLGVLLVGDEQPETLLDLCRANGTEDAPLINRLFDQMGRLITSNIDIGTLAREQGRLVGLVNEANSSKGLLVSENAALRDSCLQLEARLGEQLENYSKEAQKATELLASVEKANELSASIEQLRRNYEEELERNIELSAAAASKAEESASLTDRLQAELVRKKEFQHAVDEAKSELSRLSELTAKKDMELNRITTVACQRERELELMKGSRSWRLTAPLRVLRRTFGRTPNK